MLAEFMLGSVFIVSFIGCFFFSSFFNRSRLPRDSGFGTGLLIGQSWWFSSSSSSSSKSISWSNLIGRSFLEAWTVLWTSGESSILWISGVPGLYLSKAVALWNFWLPLWLAAAPLIFIFRWWTLGRGPLSSINYSILLRMACRGELF